MSAESFVPEKFIDKLLHKFRCDKAAKHIKSGDIVCDLGCGREGSFLKKIEGVVNKGFGFDSFVDEKFNSDKIKLRALDLNTSIPMPNSSIDVVVSMAVLEHLDDYNMFIKEICRILRKDGILVLSTPTKLVDPVLKVLGFFRLVDIKQAHDHKKYFDTEQLIKLLKDSGFTNVKVNKFQFGFNQLAIGKKC